MQEPGERENGNILLGGLAEHTRNSQNRQEAPVLVTFSSIEQVLVVLLLAMRAAHGSAGL